MECDQYLCAVCSDEKQKQQQKKFFYVVSLSFVVNWFQIAFISFRLFLCASVWKS